MIAKNIVTKRREIIISGETSAKMQSQSLRKKNKSIEILKKKVEFMICIVKPKEMKKKISNISDL